MGGHHSTMSVDMTTDIVSSVVQKSVQSCLSYVNAANVIVVSGNDNVVVDVKQTLSVSVDSACAEQVTQNTDFAASIQDTIAQTSKDTQIAGTQWLDSSRDSVSASIHESLSSSVTSTTVQDCINKIHAQNIVDIHGSGNVVQRDVQSQTVNLISQCLLGNAQVAKTVDDVTNSSNQHAEYTSKNPLDFLTDWLKALAKSMMAALAVVFIVIVCFAAVFLVVGRGHGKVSKSAQGGPAYEFRY